MREVFQLNVNGLRLEGTFHRPSPALVAESSTSDALVAEVGVLILNTGYSPRAARGDFSARVADDLAQMGYPTFRLDLPGLGDSEGEAQTEVTDFYRFVQEGGHGPFVTTAVKMLTARFKVGGMILFGNCGGAISSVYAAGTGTGESILGLVLLEPIFDLVQPSPKPLNQLPPMSRVLAKCHAWFKGYRLKAHNWLLKRPWGEKVSATYCKLRLIDRNLRASDLPATSNSGLISHWKRVATRNLPIIIFTANIPTRGTPEFDYLGYLMSRSGENVSREKVEGTTHAFGELKGRRIVTRKVIAWMHGRFPQPKRVVSPAIHWS